MTDTNTPTAPSAPVVETTADSTTVSKPFVTSKPYDDDIMDLYAKEESTPPEDATTELLAAVPKASEESKSETPKADNTQVEEATLKKAVNGKEVEFKVKDAVDAFVKREEFNRNMDRRVQAVTQKERAFTQGQEGFKNEIVKVIQQLQEGDFVNGIRSIAKLGVVGSQLQPVELERKYFDQLSKIGDIYSKLGPEAQEAWWTKRKLADVEEKANRYEQEKDFGNKTNQLVEKVKALQSQYQVPDEEFGSNFGAMRKLLVGEGKLFKSEHDIQPEDVIKYTMAVRHETKVAEAGMKVGINDDAILNMVSSITRGRPDLTEDDIAKIIEQSGIVKTANPTAVENLNKKAGKFKSQFSQVSSTKEKNGKIEGLDKEDIDYLYRKQPKVFTRPAR